MKNNLADLNNYLFAQIERLDDEKLTDDELTKEIDRGRAITNIATQIINNGNLQLKAAITAYEMGFKIKTPVLLQIIGGDEL